MRAHWRRRSTGRVHDHSPMCHSHNEMSRAKSMKRITISSTFETITGVDRTAMNTAATTERSTLEQL